MYLRILKLGEAFATVKLAGCQESPFLSTAPARGAFNLHKVRHSNRLALRSRFDSGWGPQLIFQA